VRELSGFILVIVSACGFGLMALFDHHARSGGANTETMLLMRFGIAGVMLALVMLVRRERWPRGKTLATLIFMGAVLYVGEAQCYFHGIKHAPSGLIALLLYLNPAMVTLASRVLFKERITPPRVLALTLAMIGLALTIRIGGDAGGGENVRTTALGLTLGLGCAAIYAAYLIIGSRVIARAGALPSATVVIISAACVYLVLALLMGFQPPRTPEGWTGALGLALFSTVIGITAMLAGMRRIGAVRASTLATIEPVITTVVGAMFLSERLLPVQIAGGALIIIAAAMVALTNAPRTEPEAHP
jgi:drug/metabolite transporter (DMT)-like permease